MAQSDSDDDREQIDIAVVGAGVAGTYCCWRLQAAQNGRKAVLFEMSNRIGGRLWSVPIPSIPGVMGELGGMRFLSLQRMVVSLTKYLGLPTSDFPMGGPQNIATLRGVRLRNAAFEYPQIVPYRLLPGEQGHDPGGFLVNAIKTVIPNATKLTPQQWEEVKQKRDSGTATISTTGDYGTSCSRTTRPQRESRRCCRARPTRCSLTAAATSRWWTIGIAPRRSNICSSTFHSEAKYLRLTKGYHTLPETLAEKFTDDGGTINMQHRLTQIRPIGRNGNGDRSRRRGRAEQADASLIAQRRSSWRCRNDRLSCWRRRRRCLTVPTSASC